MDSKVHFGANEQNNVEFVRQVVWQRLRKEKWNQLSVNDYGLPVRMKVIPLLTPAVPENCIGSVSRDALKEIRGLSTPCQTIRPRIPGAQARLPDYT